MIVLAVKGAGGDGGDEDGDGGGDCEWWLRS